MSLFERWLTLWVGLCIVVGIALGKLAPGVAAALDQLCSEHALAPVELVFEPMTSGDFMQKRRRIFCEETDR